MQTLDSSQPYEDLAAKALAHLNDKETRELEEFLSSLHSVELAGVLSAVDSDYQPQLLKMITGLDQLSELISHANENLRVLALRLLDDSRIAAVVRRLDIDDAADILSSLARRRQVKVMKRLGTVRVKELKALLAYESETAGRIMTTKFYSFTSDTKVKDAISKLRSDLSEGIIDTDVDLHYGYVLEESGIIQGVFSLRELLAADNKQVLSSFMNDDVLTVEADDDQEVAARLIADYDIAAIPVVAVEDGKMLGIITIDDVIDVIEEEHTEDLLRLAGTEDTDTVGASIFVALRSRMPWLIASCFGGIAGAMLLGSFTTTLEKLVALAFFMPVVFGMGGNVGSQASTITVRGLATGELSTHRIFERLQKEAMVGLFLGLSFASLLFVAALLIYGTLKLALIVAVSITTTMVCSATLGSMLPVAFNRLGIDPAVASGPLVTTSTDILSILIYFSVASALL